MDAASDANKQDVQQMKERAKWHARLSVRLGIMGVVLLLPLAIDVFAAPAVALAALVLVLATTDASDGKLARAHKRFGAVLFFGVLAHVAWIPRMIDEGEPSPLLFVSLVGFMVLSIGSMSTVWAHDDEERAERTEAQRAKTRENLQAQRKIGQVNEAPGPLTREELERLATESSGRGTAQTVAWKGTPDHVNIDDIRHPKS